LGESERKNLFQIAENAIGVNYYQLHHFLTEAPWSDSKINERRLEIMNKCSQTRISRGFSLIIDDSGHRKSGNFTDGVGRQYIGEIGKTDNGIVVVTTHLYDGRKSLPLDIELYQHASSLTEGKQEFGITSQLLLPVKSNSGEIGAIVCSHCSGDRIWTNSEINLLEAVCDQLAIAIDHAQLYTQSRSATLAAQTQAEKLTETLHKLQQTQSQLIQNEKMSSLGQLVAGVAHEINNPVNFIHGNLTYANEYFQEMLTLLHLYQQHYPNPQAEIHDFAEKIDLGFITDDLSKLLSSMNMGTNRIREIVLGLRNFCRHDEAEKKLVDIHAGIENTLLILHHRWKNNGIGLDISIVKEYGNLPLVDCYPGQLNQVFMNVLTNAIDALEESMSNLKTTDKPQIIIRTEILDNKLVVIRIADNGLGMEEDLRKRLFDPFFTTKQVGKGTGLGLSISYQIVVEKHGGILNCLSEPGKGTEFWIKIPI
jgi:signal transduction histidine kinase